jgi:FMN-dependent oxidoreductase (nitrilotriacetate monooxygenase family)
MPTNRPLVFNFFAHFTPFHESYGHWRTDEGRAMLTNWSKLDAWTELARKCEEGFFDAMFFGDTIGIYDGYRNSRDAAVSAGVQFPDGDPSVLIPAMASVTKDLGFAMTSSIIQAHPFEFARRMSSLDLLTDGRAGWNIVTSYLDSAARNMGLPKLPDHDERYAMADEYMEVTYKLWESSWDENALVADSEMLYDPARIHAIDHDGKYYKSAGPHMVQPTTQRSPLLFQAGSSPRGMKFASRHAEVAFLGSQSPQAAAGDVEMIKKFVLEAGRQAGDLLAIVMFQPIIGSTEEEATRKQREYLEWIDVEGLFAFFSGSGMDFSTIDPNRSLADLAALPAEEVGPTAAYLIAQLAASTPDATKPFGEVLRGSFTPAGRVAGTPEQIADRIEDWAAVGVDGFNIVPPMTMGWVDEWVEHVVPVLQARGTLQKSYTQGSLRNKLFGKGDRLPEYHVARSFELD